VAGFVLTAVPSWTGSRGFAGVPLVVLTILWLAGRIGFAYFDHVPFVALGLMELLFLPAVIATIGPSLLRTHNRNLILLLVITAIWATDAAFLWATKTGDMIAASAALRTGINIVLLLVTIIAGRVVPPFTANALRKRGLNVSLRSNSIVERGVILAMLAYVAADLASADSRLVAVVSAIAALLHVWRMTGWHSLKTAKDPIVWILHVAYLWLPIGLALRVCSLTAGAVWAAHWQHALTAGAAATMILAIMTRASLGHTGRPLVVSPAITTAYISLVLAIAIRVLGSALLPMSYLTIVMLAGTLWTISFGLFAFVYLPILLRPRVDGKPG
jgi:uncharacterized protein involved in response to NO